jgi:hypothetical protein
MRRCDRKCVLSVILRHLSVNIFATKYVIFYRILRRHSWSKMHHLRHVRFDWHPFYISECIGRESFFAWNLTWHHQIYCFRALRHVRFGRWAMHRMQIAGARIGALRIGLIGKLCTFISLICISLPPWLESNASLRHSRFDFALIVSYCF